MTGHDRSAGNWGEVQIRPFGIETADIQRRKCLRIAVRRRKTRGFNRSGGKCRRLAENVLATLASCGAALCYITEEKCLSNDKRKFGVTCDGTSQALRVRLSGVNENDYAPLVARSVSQPPQEARSTSGTNRKAREN